MNAVDDIGEEMAGWSDYCRAPTTKGKVNALVEKCGESITDQG